jgi:hypothetical protein
MPDEMSKDERLAAGNGVSVFTLAMTGVDGG